MTEVDWKLVEMPLARLQTFGDGEPFVYDIDWDVTVRRSTYRSQPQDFPVRLRPGVTDDLLRLAGLLPPLTSLLTRRRFAALLPQSRG